MSEVKKRKIPLAFYRRATQVGFIIFFLILFRMTDYHGTDRITGAVNIFFRWDPLAAAAAMLAEKSFIDLLAPSFLVLILTLLFGRFFCGWVCPIGTCLDASHKIIKPRSNGAPRKFASYKYYVMTAILIAAFFGVQTVGFFDPFSIFVRGLAVAVDPAFNLIVKKPLQLAMMHGPEGIANSARSTYDFLKGTLLPFNQNVFKMVLPSLLILLAIFFLEKIERRFWCRNLCPLGGMFAVFSRFSLLRLHPGKACKAQGCSTCIDVCRMRAIDDDGALSPESCSLCMECMDACPKGIVSFKFRRPKHEPSPVNVTRRGLIATVITGALMPAVMKVRAIYKAPYPFLIRPPGALAEDDFLSRCVRCGECMKVCINNALQPAGLEAGIDAAFSPVLVSRVGYCEYNCTLCGQVCPTGAIRSLTPPEKNKIKIGLAWFDRNRCLPWAKGIPCLVCEEICPVPNKAIKMHDEKTFNSAGEEVTVGRPYLVDDLCVGCGMCENKCPLTGQAAVIVTIEGESRDPENLYR